VFDKTYKLLRFFSETGTLTGRKKLQKMVHLLQRKGVSFDMDYAYHHYGPYSADLQAEVQELVDQELLVEEMKDNTYQYYLTDKGKEFLGVLQETKKDAFALPNNLMELLMDKSSPFLEVVSTYSYLLDNGYTDEEAIAKLKELKPKLDCYWEDAISFYKEKYN